MQFEILWFVCIFGHIIFKFETNTWEPTVRPGLRKACFTYKVLIFSGFKKGRNLNKLGMKGHDTAELFFEDCRVPKSAIVGELNKGFYHLMTELPQER